VTAVSRAGVLALRLERHHLTQRLPPGAADDAAYVGLQDTPPGSAGLSLAARVQDATEEDLGRLVIVPAIRGAPLAVAPDDLAVFTAGLAPPDEAAAKVLIGNAAKALDGIGAMEALDRVSEAVRDALADGPLGRDDFHQALRERLPSELLWWCKGCGSHHVHPSLWRATGIRGVLAITGREGRTAVFGAPPRAPRVTDPGGELARRFLRAYGPSTPSLFAQWSGTAPSHAKALWAGAGELAEVRIDGKRAFAARGDVERLADPAPVRGIRLLPGYDGFTAARDRELLVPDAALRKRVWRTLGNPGTVLRDGDFAGTWRASRKGTRLVLEVEAFGRRLRGARDELHAEAQTLAPWRGAEWAEVTVTA
jgi:Winged helix DNA-binding domain